MARYIDADKLSYRHLRNTSNTGGNNSMDYVTKQDIEEQPTADVKEVVGGEWEEYTTSAFIGIDKYGEAKFADKKFFGCSKCRHGTVVKHNFCPNCGADMRGKNK